MNKQTSTHDAHDCMRERVGLKAQTNRFRDQPFGCDKAAPSCARKELVFLKFSPQRHKDTKDSTVCVFVLLWLVDLTKSSASSQTGTVANRTRRSSG